MTVSHLPAVVAERDLEPVQETVLVSEPVDPTGGRLVAWSGALASAAQLGRALSATSFVPSAFRGKPEECAAAILFGDEVGLSPMQALQSVFVISGRPGMYARAMVALVQSHGHEVEQVSASDAKVVVRGRRRGSDTWTTVEWTTERARKAGYTSNKKYETDPQAMLYARAAADVCRRVAPDALAGLAYSVEELELEDSPAPQRVSRTRSTTVSRQKPAAPEPQEPAFDEPATEAEGTTTVIPMATPAQIQKLAILLGEHGIENRDARLAYISSQVKRTVTSSKDLDRAEASAVIAVLDAATAGSES